MTPQDLIGFFGSQAKVAEFFGIEPAAVCKWAAHGEVPIGRQYEAQVRTAGRLAAMTPDNIRAGGVHEDVIRSERSTNVAHLSESSNTQ